MTFTCNLCLQVLPAHCCLQHMQGHAEEEPQTQHMILVEGDGSFVEIQLDPSAEEQIEELVVDEVHEGQIEEQLIKTEEHTAPGEDVNSCENEVNRRPEDEIQRESSPVKVNRRPEDEIQRESSPVKVQSRPMRGSAKKNTGRRTEERKSAFTLQEVTHHGFSQGRNTVPPGQEPPNQELVLKAQSLPHYCYKCLDKHPSKEDLVRHQQEKHATADWFRSQKKRIFQCTMCTTQFSQKQQILRHVATHLDVKAWECPLCDMASVDNSCVLRHIELFHGINTISPRLNPIVDLDVHCIEKPGPGEGDNNTAAKTPNADTTEDSTPKMTTRSSKLAAAKETKPLRGGEGSAGLLDVSKENMPQQIFEDEAEDEEAEEMTLLKKPQECELCQQTFKFKEAFEDHCIQQHETPSFECVDCGLLFATKSACASHRESHKGKVLLVCEICEDVFSAETKLKAHMRTQHVSLAAEMEPFCVQCEMSFDTVLAWKKHNRKVHEEKSHLCTTCGKTFRTNASLVKHREIHEEIASACDLCGKIYKNERALKQHLRRHEVQGSFRCCTCHEVFDDKDTLKTHTVDCKPESDSIFECTECCKTFSVKRNYKAHMRKFHGVGSSILENARCPVCDQMFATRVHLVRHLDDKHSDYKPQQCDKCPRTFALKFQLNNHTRRKHGNPIYCPICGKSFMLGARLRDHLTTHTDDRPFACELCGSTFKTQNTLTQHINWVHKSHVRVECDICEKSFCNKESLKQHMKKRHKEVGGMYECSRCNKRFAETSQLKEHSAAEHNARPFLCRACGEGFRYASSLAAHERKQHAEQSAVVPLPEQQDVMVTHEPADESEPAEEMIILQPDETLEEMEVGEGQKVYVIVSANPGSNVVNLPNVV